MGEFFKPWRRKIGVLTLVMACVAMAVWVRSLVSYDSLQLNYSPWRYAISSGWGELNFVLAPHDTSMQFIVFGSNNKTSKEEVFPWKRANTISQWGLAGFHIRNVSFQKEEYWFCFIPYWSITIPMTLISLWLLLPAPRKSNEKKFTEPTPEKVA